MNTKNIRRKQYVTQAKAARQQRRSNQRECGAGGAWCARLCWPYCCCLDMCSGHGPALESTSTAVENVNRGTVGVCGVVGTNVRSPCAFRSLSRSLALSLVDRCPMTMHLLHRLCLRRCCFNERLRELLFTLLCAPSSFV